MAHTDKTDPWWVKARWAPVEVHNHTDGVCDLPDINEPWEYRPRPHCYWAARWWRPEFRCGCSMCSWSHWGDEPFTAEQAIREGYEDWLEGD